MNPTKQEELGAASPEQGIRPAENDPRVVLEVPRGPNGRLPARLRLGLMVFLVVCILIGTQQILWYWSHGPVYSDLKIFMTGVEIMRSGQGHDLYQFAHEEATQGRLYPATLHEGVLAYNHLAYELLLFWPLAKLSYQNALIVWGLVNLGFVAVIVWAMQPFTGELRRSLGVPIVFWVLGFYPVLFVLSQAQDSLLLLLLIVLSMRCAGRQQDFRTGLLLGGALFKVHLALGIAFFVFFIPRKWRGLAGFAVSAALVTGISWLMVGPSFLKDYLHVLREQQFVTPWGFIAAFMPNLRGLLESSLGGWLDIGSIRPLLFALSLVVVGATWISLRAREANRVTELYSVAILTTALVSYHFHMPDLAITVLPMLLLMESAARGGWTGGWTWILVVSIATLYLYRVGTWVYPKLFMRAYLLSIPVILLWLMVTVAPTHTCQAEPVDPTS